MTILGLAESFKTMNRPDPTRAGVIQSQISDYLFNVYMIPAATISCTNCDYFKSKICYVFLQQNAASICGYPYIYRQTQRGRTPPLNEYLPTPGHS